MKIYELLISEGIKIRRKSWSKNYYWVWKYDDYFDDFHLFNMKGNHAKICRADLRHSDWEYFKDRKATEIKRDLDRIKGMIIKLERKLK